MKGTVLEGNYALVINRLQGVTFALQTCELPAVTLTERNITNYPKLEYQVPGEKLIFDKLNLSFIVDGDLTNYLEILNWMFQCVDLNSSIGRPKESELISDAVIVIYDKHKQPFKQFRFHGVYPSMLSSLMFSNAGQTNNHLTCQLTLSYSHFECEETGGGIIKII